MSPQTPTLNTLPPPPPGRTGWPWTEASPLLPETMPDGQPWPRISIVTPSYNQGQFIEETIRSVLLQGYPNLEYIIIDGGSTDESVEIIRKYEPWLAYWVSEKDRGQAHGLNKGFAQTSGAIMAWINSDDLYLPGAFQAVGEIFAAYPDLVWLTSGMPSECDEQTRVVLNYASGFSSRFFSVAGYLGHLYSSGWIQQESTFWRRELWQQGGGTIDETMTLALDFELWSRFFCHSPLAVVQAPLGCFRFHNGQRSRAFMERYVAEGMRCLGLKGPIWLEGVARIYKHLRLYHIFPWQKVVKWLYGEQVMVIYPGGVGSWKQQRQKRA